jgi:acetyl-CoA carboxylase carboxyltransferase component
VIPTRSDTQTTASPGVSQESFVPNPEGNDMSQEDPRILELRAMREKVRQGGGEARIAAQHKKGKLTARERLDRLMDAGTFHELEPYVAHQGDELGIATDRIPGDGVVTGYGKIDGRPVYVYSQDFTVYGGTMSDMVSRKICA